MTLILIDGTPVAPEDPRWQAECSQRDRHLATLKRLWDRKDRAQYLSDVARAEGEEAAKRLHLAYQDHYTHEQAALAQIEASSRPQMVRMP